MIPAFDYFAPTTLGEASALLQANGPRARALAGGTALLLALERQQLSADAVVNLKGIPGLRELSFSPTTGLRIGALVTLTELANYPPIQTHYAPLIATVAQTATPQVRNLATVGGNLCSGAPMADLAVMLLALDASVSIYSPAGERTVSLDAFFPTWGGTTLTPGEILTQVNVPAPTGSAAYQRFMVREAADVPLANLAIAVESEGNVVSKARIVVGGNGPRATRMPRAEAALARQILEPAVITRAAELVAADAYPPDDLRASREYRRALIRVLVRRALTQLATRGVKQN